MDSPKLYDFPTFLQVATQLAIVPTRFADGRPPKSALVDLSVWQQPMNEQVDVIQALGLAIALHEDVIRMKLVPDLAAHVLSDVIGVRFDATEAIAWLNMADQFWWPQESKRASG